MLKNADGSEMYIGDTKGARIGATGGVNFSVNYKSITTKNNEGLYVTTWIMNFHIPTSKGYLVIESNPISDTELKSNGLNILKLANDTVDAFNMILKADPTFFDSMHGTNITISFQSGSSIAKYYNEHKGKNQPTATGLVAGLRTGSRSNSTIIIALELYLEGGHDLLTYESVNNSYPKLHVWEVIAHEFTHQKHYLAIPDYHSYDHFGRENMVIDFVNSFRSYHNNYFGLPYLKEEKKWK